MGSVAIAAICLNWICTICLNYLILTCSLDIREETIADVAVSAWAPQQVVSARWNSGPSKEGEVD